MRQSDYFHQLAWPCLQECGFQLVTFRGRESDCPELDFASSAVEYRHPSGLEVWVGFCPIDNVYGTFRFGRRWQCRKTGAVTISNYLFQFANHYGLDFRASFPLDKRALVVDHGVIKQQLADALPVIMERVTIRDLERIEELHFGAKAVAAALIRQGEPVDFECFSVQCD